MAFAHILVLVGIGLSIAANFAYVRDTLKGKTKPNRVTWFMWALAPMVGGFIALASGADPWVTSRVLIAGFLPFIVFVASFVDRQAYWKLTSFDIGCGVLSLMALVLWLLTRQSDLAIILAVAADVFASIPTVVKAWKFPETETGLAFILYSISFVIVIPAITVWDIQNTAFPIYLVLINALLVFAVYRKRLLGLAQN
jgi:hypothetical protein